MQRSNTLRAAAILLGIVLPAAGCISGKVDVGSDDQSISVPPEPDVCTTFCAVPQPDACPPRDDCVGACERQVALAPECKDALGAYLSCAARNVGPSCNGRSGIDWENANVTDACWHEDVAYFVCVSDDPRSPMSRGWGNGCGGPLSEPNREHEISTCPGPDAATLAADCSLTTGLCTCSVNDVVYDVCETLFNWDVETMSVETCCATLLDVGVSEAAALNPSY